MFLRESGAPLLRVWQLNELVSVKPRRNIGLGQWFADDGGWEMKMVEELRVLVQPGAVIAIVAVLLLMAAGDAAIMIAAKGWPF